MFRISLPGGMFSYLSRALVLVVTSVGCVPSVAKPAEREPDRNTTSRVEALRAAAIDVRAEGESYDAVLDRIGDARVVLLGEASHGTEEFYRARAEISRRLITERGFDAIIIEGDWPATARVDRFVRGMGTDRSAAEALGDFHRFPQWMWRNHAFAELVAVLAQHNRTRTSAEQVRVFGMDVYSPVESAAEVVAYLGRRDPVAARSAKQDLGCLEHAADFAIDSDDESCARSIQRVQKRLAAVASRAPAGDAERFSALQNARVARNAERYYRLAVDDSVKSWNHRDRHMLATLEAIEQELRRERGDVRVIVWAHNSHLGDARATEMARRGELNLGQLARERWEDAVVNVGFTTYGGTVRAAPGWDDQDRVYAINPGRHDSVESLFHRVGKPAFMLRLDAAAVAAELSGTLLQRAIGVIYRPDTERRSHYFETKLPQQFDIVIHFDTTHAVVPLS